MRRISGPTKWGGDVVNLSRYIADKHNLEHKQSRAIVNDIFEKIRFYITKHHSFKAKGFGSFILKKRKARLYIEPQNGTTVEAPASYYVKFQESKLWLDMVNRPKKKKSQNQEQANNRRPRGNRTT